MFVTAAHGPETRLVFDFKAKPVAGPEGHDMSAFVLTGQNANTIAIRPEALRDAGVYSVAVIDANRAGTNRATLTLTNPANLNAQMVDGILRLIWPPGYTGRSLQSQTSGLCGGLGTNWRNVPDSRATNFWSLPFSAASPNMLFRRSYP